MSAGVLEVLDTVGTMQSAVTSMAEYARSFAGGVGNLAHIAVGTSDASSSAVAEALTIALENDPAVADIVQYRIGPSIGAHTGPGTAGLFVFYARSRVSQVPRLSQISRSKPGPASQVLDTEGPGFTVSGECFEGFGELHIDHAMFLRYCV